MGIVARTWARLTNRSPTSNTVFRMAAIEGDAIVWDDNVYRSDVVMSAIRPYVHAIGKTVAKHIFQTFDEKTGKRSIQVNPEAYIRFLLEDPNPLMTGQELREWQAASLKINNHSFTLILRDDNGFPVGLYPINASLAVAEYDAGSRLFIRFYMPKGQQFRFPYEDLIHLRGDPQTGSDFFGGSKVPQLLPLMEQIGTIDRGIIRAIKNGAIIRWLLKFTSNLSPEDVKTRAQAFANQFLNAESGFGVAATDSKAEAIQIKPNDYVPNSALRDGTVKRFYAALNTNEKIVMSSFTEDEWNAYYESEIEPDVIRMGNQYTRKLFSRKKRSYGNYIMFEANNLATASMKTKLELREMVDRGAMTPNEWREVFNRAPIPGGDDPIRRLDTAVVETVKEE